MDTLKNTMNGFVERTTIVQFLSEHEAIARLYVLVCNHHHKAFKEDKKGCVSLFNLAYLVCYLASKPDCPYAWIQKAKIAGMRKIYYDSAFCLALALLRIHDGLIPIPQYTSSRLHLRCLHNELYKLMEQVVKDFRGNLVKPINFSGAPLPPTKSPTELFLQGREMIMAGIQHMEDGNKLLAQELVQKKAELEQTKAELAEVEQRLADQLTLYATEKENHREEIARLSQQLKEASKKQQGLTDEWKNYPTMVFRHFDDENVHKAILEAGRACHGPQHFACLYVICNEYNCLNDRNSKMLFARAIVALGLIMPSEGKGLEETAEQLRSGMTRYINQIQYSSKDFSENTLKVIDEKRSQLEGIFKEYRLDGKRG